MQGCAADAYQGFWLWAEAILLENERRWGRDREIGKKKKKKRFVEKEIKKLYEKKLLKWDYFIRTQPLSDHVTSKSRLNFFF